MSQGVGYGLILAPTISVQVSASPISYSEPADELPAPFWSVLRFQLPTQSRYSIKRNSPQQKTPPTGGVSKFQTVVRPI